MEKSSLVDTKRENLSRTGNRLRNRKMKFTSGVCLFQKEQIGESRYKN